MIYLNGKKFFQDLLCVVLLNTVFSSQAIWATDGGGAGAPSGAGGSKGRRILKKPQTLPPIKPPDIAGGGAAALLEDKENHHPLTPLLIPPQPPQRYTGPSVQEIYRGLSSRIVGEDKAMKDLATYYFRHVQVQEINEDLEYDGLEHIKKLNLLMMGPSGSGKTASIKLLAKIANVPFYEADTSTMTRSGYVGDSVISAIDGLLRTVNYDVSLAEKGIVFFDEIDKIAEKEDRGGRDMCGADVQSELLKLLEGKKVSVRCPGPFPGIDRVFEVDTSKILFIGAGAFSYLPEKDEPYTTDDIISAGFKKEFVGRFGKLIQFQGATEDTLLEILSNPQSPIVRDNSLILKRLGINVNFTDEAARILSKRAFTLGIGVRGLETYVVQITEPLLLEHHLWKGHEVIIDAGYIATHFPEPKREKRHEPWMDMYS